MGAASDDAVKQLALLMDQVEAPLRRTFQNVHQGYPKETLLRFLKAREWNVSKAHKMLVDSLNWRIQNEIDTVLEVVKPLLQERTKNKVKVLHGCGRDELLKIMDYSSLPHFCRREGSGSSKHSSTDADDCYSLDHPFHKELYGHIEEQASRKELIKMGSLHVSIPEPDPDDAKIVEVIQAEFQKIGEQNGSTNGHMV